MDTMCSYGQMLLSTLAICSMLVVGDLSAREPAAKQAGLRIAAVSCAVYYSEPQKNLSQIAKWTKTAAGKGADLVLFNETCVTGYVYSREVRKFAEPLSGPAIRELTRIAAENNVIICAGMPEKCYKQVHNTQVLVGPKGLLGFHRKSSLPSGEETRFEVGHDTNVSKVRGVKLGIAICYESIQPDTCKALADKGAQVILAPYSNGVTAAEIHGGKRPYFQERAKQNGVWYVACDQAHVDRNAPDKPPSPGAVCFVNPKGEIVATTSLDEPSEHMMVWDVRL